jgi:hypothetical protein
MFRGKINRSNSRLLLTILERLRNGEREVLTVNTLFNHEAVLHESSITIEVFLYIFYQCKENNSEISFVAEIR